MAPNPLFGGRVGRTREARNRPPPRGGHVSHGARAGRRRRESHEGGCATWVVAFSRQTGAKRRHVNTTRLGPAHPAEHASAGGSEPQAAELPRACTEGISRPEIRRTRVGTSLLIFLPTLRHTPAITNSLPLFDTRRPCL